MMGGPGDLVAPGLVARVAQQWARLQLRRVFTAGGSGGGGNGSGGGSGIRGNATAQPVAAEAEASRV